MSNGGETYKQAISYTHKRPAFTPKRTIAVSNASQLQAAISNLRPGDLVKATRASPSAARRLIIEPALAPRRARPQRRPFRLLRTADEPAPLVNNARNLYIYGGDLSTSNTGGTCLTRHGSQHVLWWGFHLHDCGGSGFAA